jgi:hypothetical protein
MKGSISSTPANPIALPLVFHKQKAFEGHPLSALRYSLAAVCNVFFCHRLFQQSGVYHLEISKGNRGLR